MNFYQLLIWIFVTIKVKKFLIFQLLHTLKKNYWEFLSETISCVGTVKPCIFGYDRN